MKEYDGFKFPKTLDRRYEFKDLFLFFLIFLLNSNLHWWKGKRLKIRTVLSVKACNINRSPGKVVCSLGKIPTFVINYLLHMSPCETAICTPTRLMQIQRLRIIPGLSLAPRQEGVLRSKLPGQGIKVAREQKHTQKKIWTREKIWSEIWTLLLKMTRPGWSSWWSNDKSMTGFYFYFA